MFDLPPLSSDNKLVVMSLIALIVNDLVETPYSSEYLVNSYWVVSKDKTS